MKIFVLNNKGFTLLEALMSMFVMTFLVFTLVMWMQLIATQANDYQTMKQVIIMENYVHDDFIGIKNIDINSKSIILHDYNNATITYKLSDGKIIKQKNNKGNEVLLTGVQSVHFYQDNRTKTVHMEVDFKNEENIDVILSATAF